jgi:hypothetical protein
VARSRRCTIHVANQLRPFRNVCVAVRKARPRDAVIFLAPAAPAGSKSLKHALVFPHRATPPTTSHGRHLPRPAPSLPPYQPSSSDPPPRAARLAVEHPLPLAVEHHPSSQATSRSASLAGDFQIRLPRRAEVTPSSSMPSFSSSLPNLIVVSNNLHVLQSYK